MIKLIIFILLILGVALGVYFVGKKESPTTLPTSSKTKNITPIKAVGDNKCIEDVNQALALLKAKATVHFEVVVEYLGTIECVSDNSDIFDYDKPARVKFAQLTLDEGVFWLAGAIAHEACHAKQYNDYRVENLTKKVPDEVYKGRNAESQCLDAQANALEKLGADKDTIDYVKKSINEEYWKVPDRIRWW